MEQPLLVSHDPSDLRLGHRGIQQAGPAVADADHAGAGRIFVGLRACRRNGGCWKEASSVDHQA